MTNLVSRLIDMNHAVEEDPEENVSEQAANKRVSDGQPAVQEIRLPFEVRLEHPEQRLQQHRHEIEDESGHVRQAENSSNKKIVSFENHEKIITNPTCGHPRSSSMTRSGVFQRAEVLTHRSFAELIIIYFLLFF